MPSTQRLSYIDGLKGIAILLIVLFHMLPQVFSSGYMGVDVFFVVSGYFLLGRQLQGDAEFRLMDFLKKKALRLLVPYFAILVLVPLMTVVLFPASEQLAGVRLLRACQFIYGNIYLDGLSGNYFSTDARAFPLMHLWYMGVLLQCYALFTLLFTVWHYSRCRRKTRIIHVSLLGVISLGVAYLRFAPFSWEYANDTYYWTSARVWEFVLGGLLYILPKPQSRIVSGVAGACALMLLLAGSFLPVRENAWMILLGAACGGVLLRSGFLWERFSPLRCTSLVWLGTISFSLYLIHWPCICFAEFILGQQLSCVAAAPMLLLILLFAWLFFKCVESVRAPMWILPVLAVGSVLLHRAICKTDGFRNLMHRETNQAIKALGISIPRMQPLAASSPLLTGAEGIAPNNFTKKPEPNAKLLFEVGDSHRQPTFVIIGDSHADDFSAGMHLLAWQHGWHGLFLNSYVTPFWNSELRADPNVAIGNFCNEDKVRRIMKWLESHPELRTIFIAQYWSNRMHPHFSWVGEQVTGDIVQVRIAELREFCLRLRGMGREVVLLTDTPSIEAEAPTRLLHSYLMYPMWKEFPSALECSKADYERDNGAFNHGMDKLAQEGVCSVLHREKAFFKTDVFRVFDGNHISHRDRHHLTTSGVLFGLSSVMEQVEEIMRGHTQE